MKTYPFYILFFAAIFSLTSCLELTEEVKMNDDGSGSATLTINLSESKDNIKHYLSQEEYQGMKIPKISDIEASLVEMEAVMRNVSGLSNVQSQKNFEDYVFSFSGDFANVEVLNQAVNALVKEMSKKSPTGQVPIIKDNFSYKNGQFKRHFDYPIDTKLYDQMGFMQQFFMENARLTGIYRFPSTVQSTSNTKTSVSSSQKSVMLQTNVAEIAKGETTIENIIQY